MDEFLEKWAQNMVRYHEAAAEQDRLRGFIAATKRVNSLGNLLQQIEEEAITIFGREYFNRRDEAAKRADAMMAKEQS